MTAGALLDGARRDTAARLKWRVCALCGIRPFSREWRKMTRRRVLRCALHLVLDMQARGGLPGRAGEGNPNFDEARFSELRRAEG